MRRTGRGEIGRLTGRGDNSARAGANPKGRAVPNADASHIPDAGFRPSRPDGANRPIHDAHRDHSRPVPAPVPAP
jgi:hypothetical protein